MCEANWPRVKVPTNDTMFEHAKKKEKDLVISKKPGFDPLVRKIPWSRKWQPTSVFLPGKFH